ncbi:MAG: protease [Pseudonocardiales bacterium]|jgi:protease I|nr:protease [Pseudonocardiales bacterium]
MKLENARVAVLVENMYQELELWYPVLRLREAGVEVTIVGPIAGEVYASKLGYPAVAEAGIDDVTADDFDAVVVPGGFSPEYLRRNPAIVDLVRSIDARGDTVAAICHAGWLLATADIVQGRKVTSVPVIKDDVIHAGGEWQNEPVVVDGNLITSQLPNDLPAFLLEIINSLENRPERDEPERDRPARTLPASSAVYREPALLKNRAAAPGSANYRAYAVRPGA